MILRTKVLLAQINIKSNGYVSNGNNNLLNMRVETLESENQQNSYIPSVTINELNDNSNENLHENNDMEIVQDIILHAKLLQDQILQSNLISNDDFSNGDEYSSDINGEVLLSSSDQNTNVSSININDLKSILKDFVSLDVGEMKLKNVPSCAEYELKMMKNTLEN